MEDNVVGRKLLWYDFLTQYMYSVKYQVIWNHYHTDQNQSTETGQILRLNKYLYVRNYALL